MIVRSRVLAPQGSRHTLASLTMALFLVVSLFASIAGVNGAAAQTLDTSLAETVPADSVIYVSMNLDQQSDQWMQFYALLDRAGLSDLAEDQASTSPEDLGSLAESYEFTGTAAIVFTSAEALAATSVDEVTGTALEGSVDPEAMTEDIPEGMVVVFQPENPEALYANFQQMVADEAAQVGRNAETTEYNGVTIDFWTSDDPAVAPTATALVGDTVVLSVRPTDIEPVIDTVDGDTESLATNSDFMSVSQAFTTDSLMFGYVDSRALVDAALTSDPELSQMTTGYDASELGAAGWNAYVEDAGFRLDTVALSDGTVSPSVLNPTMAERMPAETLLFVNGTNIAGTGFGDALGMFLSMSLAETGMGTPAVEVTATPTTDEVYAELESMLGFNIRTDLIDQLDGEWALAAQAEQVFSDAPIVDVVFVSEVADEATVENTLSQISFIVGAAVDGETSDITEREVEGGSVSSVTVPDMLGPGVNGALEWGVVNGELLFGLNGGIDQYLNGATSTLADEPVYQQTFEALPSTDLVSVQFINLERTIPMIEEAVMSLESSFEVLDNDEACAEYATQEEAQAAYDEDPFGLWNLDLDYDGEACEDFFGTPDVSAATPESLTEDIQILSVGSVSYAEDGLYRTDSILLIGE